MGWFSADEVVTTTSSSSETQMAAWALVALAIIAGAYALMRAHNKYNAAKIQAAVSSNPA